VPPVLQIWASWRWCARRPEPGPAVGNDTTRVGPHADTPATLDRRSIKEWHMRQSRPRREAGFTFVELTFAVLILVVSAVVLVDHITVNFKTTATERDRVFAYSKAQAILAEIQAFVDRGQVNAAVDLDVLDDGIVSKNPLTIQQESGALVLPDHVVSGNYQRSGQWIWSRRITVQPFLGLNNRNVRYVTVRIYKRDDSMRSVPPSTASQRPISVRAPVV
jgi:hypothetical protein